MTTEAKEYMMQLKKRNLQIENKLAERQQIRDMAFNITSRSDGERVQSSGNQQKMAGAIEKLIDLEREIDSDVDALVDKRREIIATIEMLKPAEYDILHHVYVQYDTLAAYAALRGKEYTWATTLHGRALKSVQAILDARAGADEKSKNFALVTNSY